MDTTITLTTEFIKLDAALKLAGVADSGGRAKHMIQEGLVSVNGEPTTLRGKKIREGDAIEVSSEPPVRIVVETSAGETDAPPESAS